MVAVNSSPYGPVWTNLVKEKNSAIENLEKARKTGDDMQIAHAEKKLAETKLEMSYYDKGFSAGRAYTPEGVATKLDKSV